ncbi:protein POLR1D-like [Trichogramma pretiosum]|uniref:protein POLR1D-like n=1 Tax=Trichogramma pretiosum TaxID=7493 RepID=UPI0006C97BD8|nr:protein POLR1D-like [Trichogramma pretiosum]
MDDETLTRMAAEALLKEAKEAERRADVMGPSGYVKKKDSINKRFLHSTLRNAIQSNKHKSKSYCNYSNRRQNVSDYKDSKYQREERISERKDSKYKTESNVKERSDRKYSTNENVGRDKDCQSRKPRDKRDS